MCEISFAVHSGSVSTIALRWDNSPTSSNLHSIVETGNRVSKMRRKFVRIRTRLNVRLTSVIVSKCKGSFLIAMQWQKLHQDGHIIVVCVVLEEINGVRIQKLAFQKWL